MRLLLTVRLSVATRVESTGRTCRKRSKTSARGRHRGAKDRQRSRATSGRHRAVSAVCGGTLRLYLLTYSTGSFCAPQSAPSLKTQCELGVSLHRGVRRRGRLNAPHLHFRETSRNVVRAATLCSRVRRACTVIWRSTCPTGDAPILFTLPSSDQLSSVSYSTLTSCISRMPSGL